jgi:hypothetical protein
VAGRGFGDILVGLSSGVAARVGMTDTAYPLRGTGLSVLLSSEWSPVLTSHNAQFDFGWSDIGGAMRIFGDLVRETSDEVRAVPTSPQSPIGVTSPAASVAVSRSRILTPPPTYRCDATVPVHANGAERAEVYLKRAATPNPA